MNKVILSNIQHPLYSKLKQLEDFQDYSGKEEINSADLLLDFTALPSEEKRDLYKKFDGKIISELAINTGEALVKEFNLAGAISCIFPSPKSNCELFLQDETLLDELTKVLNSLNLKAIRVKSAGTGFIYPRVISGVINEAWFALEDKLATSEAIDTAMLFGVNYPLGPIELGEAAGLKNVVILLDELYKSTNQDRYKAAPKLEASQL